MYDNIDQKSGKGFPVTCQGSTDRGESTAVRSISVAARTWWVASATPWLLYSRERDPVPIVQETGSASLGLVWMDPRNLTS